jgi:hypothetical protein
VFSRTHHQLCAQLVQRLQHRVAHRSAMSTAVKVFTQVALLTSDCKNRSINLRVSTELGIAVGADDGAIVGDCVGLCEDKQEQEVSERRANTGRKRIDAVFQSKTLTIVLSCAKARAQHEATSTRDSFMIEEEKSGSLKQKARVFSDCHAITAKFLTPAHRDPLLDNSLNLTRLSLN